MLLSTRLLQTELDMKCAHQYPPSLQHISRTRLKYKGFRAPDHAHYLLNRLLRYFMCKNFNSFLRVCPFSRLLFTKRRKWGLSLSGGSKKKDARSLLHSFNVSGIIFYLQIRSKFIQWDRKIYIVLHSIPLHKPMVIYFAGQKYDTDQNR